MPDVILPTIALGITAIGGLVTVRNGIDIILQDKYHIQNSFVMDLVLVGAEITVLDDRLHLWKKLWSIFDGVPQSLFVTFWGESGASQIKRLLGTTEQISLEIEKQFESMYGGVRDAARRRLLELRPLDQAEPTSERQRQEMTKRLKAEYDEQVKLRKKINLGLFQSPAFQSHTRTLETSIEKLEDLSRLEFEKHNEFKYDEEYARDLGLQSVLLDFANKVSEPISKLFMWCKRRSLPETMAIDLHLDLAYQCEMEPRNKFLAQRAARAGYPYYLRLPNDANAEDGYLLVALESEAEHAKLDPLIEELATNPHGGAGRPTQKSESLRKILLSSPKELVESHYHPFSRPERYKLAYELSEVFFVLLTSRSLGELCVCAIRRLCCNSAMQEYEHLIRIRNAHELEGNCQTVEDPDRWCGRELLERHILRLGIVLVEVATGAVVKDVKYDSLTRAVKVTLKVADSAEELKDYTPEKVADMVKAAGGTDFGQAVYYCLHRDVLPNFVNTEDVVYFYHNVVAPLYLHYYNQVLKPRLRRLHRLDSLGQ